MLRFLPFIVANLRRRKARTLFTLLAIAVAFLLFGLLAAVRNGFDAGVTLAGADRLITLQKVSIVQPLPLAYQSRIESVPSISRSARRAPTRTPRCAGSSRPACARARTSGSLRDGCSQPDVAR